MDKKMMNVYQTDNYKRFKKLDQNRDVKDPRVKKIIDSIRKVGYVCNPIIVNEKNEVIDGQGRLEACTRLGIPVFYIVVPGIGIDECRQMNMNQSNWTTQEYVKSYAEGGNTSYIYLQQLLKEYGNQLGLNTLYAIAYGNSVAGIGYVSASIRGGRLKFTQSDYEEARGMCDYLLGFYRIICRVGGKHDSYYGAIRFMVTRCGANRTVLLDRLTKRQADLIPVSSVEQALGIIEDCYNYRTREKIYAVTEYKKWIDANKHKKRTDAVIKKAV